jgi:hypothetical protein
VRMLPQFTPGRRDARHIPARLSFRRSNRVLHENDKGKGRFWTVAWLLVQTVTLAWAQPQGTACLTAIEAYR